MTPSAPPPPGATEITVFFTGNELGALRPCGCSGGQLGGLEKRAAVFNRVPAARRVLVATGGLVETDREQDLMKYRILFEAMRLLNYDVLRLTGKDRQIGARLGILQDVPGPFRVIGLDSDPGPAPEFTRRLAVGDGEMTIRVACADSLSAFLESPSFSVAPQEAAAVNILLLEHADPNLLRRESRQAPGVDCIVCPSNGEEPQVLSRPGEVPMILTVGRFARYVARLDVQIGQPGGRPVLHFESIPLKAALPDDPALMRLYRQYQQLVAQSDLLENYPRLPLADKLAFVGSESCNECHDHEAEYDEWLTTGHARALVSLQEVGSDRDPECLICHVSGLEYEGGYINQQETLHLAGVGCENCHGPGSAHVQGHGKVPMGQPKTPCIQCHTPEQSGEFAGHEEEFMKKILHWKEPAAAGNVK